MSATLVPDDDLLQLSYLQIGNWIAGGAAALFFYDWILCIDREIEFVWRARWTLGKVLFLAHRYPMMALVIGYTAATISQSVKNPSAGSCHFWDDLSNYGTIVIFAIVEATLIVRLFALYHKSKRVLAFLLCVFCVCISTTFALYHSYRTMIVYEDNPLAPTINFCARICTNCQHWTTYVYLPLLILDVVILLFTLRQSWYSSYTRSAAPTLMVLFRDGIIYFIVIFGCMLTNVLFLSFAPSGMEPWFVPFMRPLISSMATRLILNLHGQMHVVADPWLPTATANTAARGAFSSIHFSTVRTPTTVTFSEPPTPVTPSPPKFEQIMEMKNINKSKASNIDRVHSPALIDAYGPPVQIFVNSTRIIHHERSPSDESTLMNTDSSGH